MATPTPNEINRMANAREQFECPVHHNAAAATEQIAATICSDRAIIFSASPG
jgi:hypothetical protein